MKANFSERLMKCFGSVDDIDLELSKVKSVESDIRKLVDGDAKVLGLLLNGYHPWENVGRIKELESKINKTMKLICEKLGQSNASVPELVVTKAAKMLGIEVPW